MIAGSLPAMVEIGNLSAAVDRVIARLRESVAARLLGCGYEDVVLDSRSAWMEASAGDLGGLAPVRDALSRARHASMSGSPPEWPGVARDVVERPMLDRWRREDTEAPEVISAGRHHPAGALVQQVAGARG